MTTYLGQSLEVDEMNKILQSLLQINGSLTRLDVQTDEIYITIPKMDWLYIVRISEQNKNGKFFKFYSKEADLDYFKLGNIKVKHG